MYAFTLQDMTIRHRWVWKSKFYPTYYYFLMEAVGFSWLQEIFYRTKQPADVSEAIKGTNVHVNL